MPTCHHIEAYGDAFDELSEVLVRQIVEVLDETETEPLAALPVVVFC